MSWLSNLASKTENLLNKVDQAAGQALQNNNLNEESDQINTHFSEAHFSKIENYNNENFDDTLLSSSKINSSYQTSTYSPRNQSSKLIKPSIKKDPDSELFDFLNSSESQNFKKEAPLISANDSSVYKSSSLEHSQEPIVQNSVDSSTPPYKSSFLNKNELSKEDKALLMENQLLKNEIQSMNQEMQSIMSRVKHNQNEANKSGKKLETQNKQLSMKEKMVRELQERESDLLKTIDSKDSQLGILRIRLEEADFEIKEKDTKINKIQAEKHNILQDHSESTGVQSQAMDTLENKINQLEKSLRIEKEKNNKLEVDLREKEKKLEEEKEELVSQVCSLQKSLSRERMSISETGSQLKLAKSQAETARQELNQYKEKATRILQSKDKLIVKLKETSGTTATSSSVAHGDESPIHSTELESLRQERDMLREELHNTLLSLEATKAELQDLEHQSQRDNEQMKDQMNEMEESVTGEKRKRGEFEAEVSKLKEENKYLHEELVKKKSSFQARLQDKEADIQKLRNQLTTKSVSMTSQEELENRLHSLTESLIQKQTALETLSSEKNSLTFQLERVERQCKEAEMSALRATSSSIHMNNDDEDVRSRFSSLVKESPLDGRVTRKMKNAANTVDRFSIRLGRFLRVYPIARVFILIYMFFLHFWVMMVIFTYKPEIHPSDFKSGLHH